MPDYPYRALHNMPGGLNEREFLETARIFLRGTDTQKFAEACFRMSVTGLAEKVHALEFALPYVAMFGGDLGVRMLLLIAEEVLDILQLDPEGFTDTIPHYAELKDLRK